MPQNTVTPCSNIKSRVFLVIGGSDVNQDLGTGC